MDIAAFVILVMFSVWMLIYSGAQEGSDVYVYFVLSLAVVFCAIAAGRHVFCC